MADTNKKKPKSPEFLTPKASCAWPKLIVPDHGSDKFNKPDGEYSIKLLLSGDDAEVIRKNAGPQLAAFIEQDIAATQQELVEATNGKAIAKLKELLADKQKAATEGFKMSMDNDVDNAGNPTGSKLVTFKQKAINRYKNRQGGEDVVKRYVPLFDAKGNAIQVRDDKGAVLPNAIRIYSGTVVRTRYIVIPSYIAASKSYWASLRPLAVQIVKLVDSPSERDAAGYGFQSEEDGFDASAADLPSTPAEGASGAEAY